MAENVFSSERYKLISDYLKEHQRATVEQLAKYLYVSAATSSCRMRCVLILRVLRLSLRLMMSSRAKSRKNIRKSPSTILLTELFSFSYFRYPSFETRFESLVFCFGNKNEIINS